MRQIDLCIFNKKLIQSKTIQFPFEWDIYQGSGVLVTVTDFEQSAPGSALTKIDHANSGLHLVISSNPVGGADELIYAQQLDFTWDAVNKRFGPAQILFNTEPIDTFLTNINSGTAHIEINLINEGLRTPIYYGSVTINAIADTGALVAPVPTESYMTRSECLAMFARLKGTPGQSISLVSPDGSKEVQFAVDNDGQVQSPLIQ